MGFPLISPATRRMHDKTQVFSLTSDDNIHSRSFNGGYANRAFIRWRVCEDEKFLKATELDKKDIHIPVILKMLV